MTDKIEEQGNETRVVLVKPGDVLLIGNAGHVTAEAVEAIRGFSDAIGIKLAVFSDDISVEVSSADARWLATANPSLGAPVDEDLLRAAYERTDTPT